MNDQYLSFDNWIHNMKVQGPIGRRCERVFKDLDSGDYESALLNLFSALDSTSKKRRNIDKVGQRFRAFIDDELAFITFLATGNVMQGCTYNGKTIPQAIYTFARNPLTHEGGLDPRIRFLPGGDIAIGPTWNLPIGFIWAMLIAVITAPENKDEFLQANSAVNHKGKNFLISDLWGSKKPIIDTYPFLRKFYPHS